MNNAYNKGFASFAPTFLSATYNLPEKEISVTIDWVKSFKIDYAATDKMMMVKGKNFRHK